MNIEENRKKLAQLIKNAPSTPLQEVKPTSKREGYHFNIWVNPDMEYKLKRYALENKTTLKEIGILALEEFLKNNTKY